MLDHLDELDPTSVADLSQHMGVTPSTMSIAIDRLERKGFVVRRRDAVDRRRVHVRLTAAGVRVREASSVLDRNRVEALVASLSDDDRSAAVRGLALLASAAGAQGGTRRSDERRRDGRQEGGAA